MSGSSGSPARWLVATDLDGTLLDHETYSFEAARPALALLAERSIPLVLVTSKTRAEAEAIAALIGTPPLLVVENGGAVVVPEGSVGTRTIGLGVPYPRLVEALDAIALEAGASVRGFSSLSRREVEDLTGLRGAAAERARVRGFDEPFLVSDPGVVPALEKAAARRGLAVTRGGRFHHLVGAGTDKGRALRALLRLPGAGGEGVVTVGLGDAANDLSLLQAVDRPVIVPRPNGAPDAVLAAELPGAETAPAPGPAGWNAAVLAILSGERLSPGPR
ncbi:MAG TPA: HAD-IIB family hydrolase [Vicinamibacteria bacterium]